MVDDLQAETVKLPPRTLKPDDAKNPRKAKVLTGMYLRVAGDKAGMVITVIPEGSEIIVYEHAVIDEDGYHWSYVEYGEKSGFMAQNVDGKPTFNVIDLPLGEVPTDPPPFVEVPDDPSQLEPPIDDAVFGMWATLDEVKQTLALERKRVEKIRALIALFTELADDSESLVKLYEGMIARVETLAQAA